MGGEGCRVGQPITPSGKEQAQTVRGAGKGHFFLNIPSSPFSPCWPWSLGSFPCLPGLGYRDGTGNPDGSLL